MTLCGEGKRICPSNPAERTRDKGEKLKAREKDARLMVSILRSRWMRRGRKSGFGEVR